MNNYTISWPIDGGMYWVQRAETLAEAKMFCNGLIHSKDRPSHCVITSDNGSELHTGIIKKDVIDWREVGGIDD